MFAFYQGKPIALKSTEQPEPIAYVFQGSCAKHPETTGVDPTYCFQKIKEVRNLMENDTKGVRQ